MKLMKDCKIAEWDYISLMLAKVRLYVSSFGPRLHAFEDWQTYN